MQYYCPIYKLEPTGRLVGTVHSRPVRGNIYIRLGLQTSKQKYTSVDTTRLQPDRRYMIHAILWSHIQAGTHRETRRYCTQPSGTQSWTPPMVFCTTNRHTPSVDTTRLQPDRRYMIRAILWFDTTEAGAHRETRRYCTQPSGTQSWTPPMVCYRAPIRPKIHDSCNIMVPYISWSPPGDSSALYTAAQ